MLAVPKGSVLGPLLFLIMINDLPLSLKNDDSVLFADDTHVILSGVPDQIGFLLDRVKVVIKGVN